MGLDMRDRKVGTPGANHRSTLTLHNSTTRDKRRYRA